MRATRREIEVGLASAVGPGMLAEEGVKDVPKGRAIVNARRAAVAMWGLCVLLAGPTLALLAVGPGHVLPGDIFAGVGGVAFLVLGLTFASVGAVVAVRVPDNRIGWIFCLTGFWSAVQLITWQFADVGLHAHDLPGAEAADVFNTIIGEATAGLLGLALILFPDGRLPSRRWRPALWTLLGGMFLLAVAGTFRPGRYSQPFASQSNPLGLPGTRGAMNAVDVGGWLLVLAGFALGAAALVVRLRRARGIERQQLKLVLAVGTVAALGAAALMGGWLISPELQASGRTGIAALGFILTTFPLAAGVAILRYRLYDIDRLISRTLSYLLLTAVLACVYVGMIVLTTRLLPFSSPVGVAASTLAAAALFNPLRRRLQRLVDRRFNRSRYDADELVAAFGSRLRDAVAPETVRDDLLGTVAGAVEPAHLSLWIRADASP
jgi:hypothetical protein